MFFASLTTLSTSPTGFSLLQFVITKITFPFDCPSSSRSQSAINIANQLIKPQTRSWWRALIRFPELSGPRSWNFFQLGQ